MNWSMAPGQEIGILYNAAAVLAHRGKEQACESVLDALKSTYAEDARQLRQAGVQPNQVETYRKQQLARAQPVIQASHAFRADAITGTDVRNLQDQDLGSIEDVVLDPKTGQVSYAIIARGGFLGIGDEHVAVPWPRLKVAPNMAEGGAEHGCLCARHYPGDAGPGTPGQSGQLRQRTEFRAAPAGDRQVLAAAGR